MAGPSPNLMSEGGVHGDLWDSVGQTLRVVRRRLVAIVAVAWR